MPTYDLRTGSYKQKEGGVLPKAQIGKDVQSTAISAQDYIDAYNHAIALENYMKNRLDYHSIDSKKDGYYGGDIPSSERIYNDLNSTFNRWIDPKRQYPRNILRNNILTEDVLQKDIPILDYYQQIDENKFKQRELLDGTMNMDIPMGYYDKRIPISQIKEYSSNYPARHDGVTIPMYDQQFLKDEMIKSDPNIQYDESGKAFIPQKKQVTAAPNKGLILPESTLKWVQNPQTGTWYQIQRPQDTNLTPVYDINTGSYKKQKQGGVLTQAQSGMSVNEAYNYVQSMYNKYNKIPEKDRGYKSDKEFENDNKKMNIAENILAKAYKVPPNDVTNTYIDLYYAGDQTDPLYHNAPSVWVNKPGSGGELGLKFHDWSAIHNQNNIILPIKHTEAPALEIIPQTFNYTPKKQESIEVANRGQTVMEPDPDRPGKYRMKEMRQVPYAAKFPGEGTWEPANAPRVIYVDAEGNETEERPGAQLNTLNLQGETFKQGGALLTKKVTCKKCGWEWDAADGGDDVTTCHKCGGQGLVHAQNGGQYTYGDRDYKKDSKGNWSVAVKGVWTPLSKNVEARTKELNKNAKFVRELQGYNPNQSSGYDMMASNKPQVADNTRVFKEVPDNRTLTEIKKDDEFKATKKKIESDFNKTTQYYEDYHESPMYKKMLNNSAGKNASFFSDNRTSNLLGLSTPTVLRTQPIGEEGTGGWSMASTGNITVAPRGYKVQGILPHEISHSIDRPIGRGSNRLIPGKDIAAMTKFKPKNFVTSPQFKKLDVIDQKDALENPEIWKDYTDWWKDWNDYVGKPTETRARLNDIRMQSKLKGLYDPFTQKVSPDIYKKLLNTPFDKDENEEFDALQQLKDVYTDEQIQWMLNNISQNQEEDQEDIEQGVARRGGTNKVVNAYSKHFQPGGFQDDLDKNRKVFEDWTYGKDLGMTYLPKAQNGIIISDPKEYAYRNKMYTDSLNLYNAYKMQDKLMGPYSGTSKSKYKWNTAELKKGRKKNMVPGISYPIADDYQNEKEQFKDGFNLSARPQDLKLIKYYKSLGFTDKDIMYHSSPDVVSDKIRAVGTYDDGTAASPIYRKPKQKVTFGPNNVLPVEEKLELKTKPLQFIDTNRDIQDIVPNADYLKQYLQTRSANAIVPPASTLKWVQHPQTGTWYQIERPKNTMLTPEYNIRTGTYKKQ